MMGCGSVKVAKSTVVPMNQFPKQWRENISRLLSIEEIAKSKVSADVLSDLDGVDFLAQTLLSEEGKTIILATGPASNLVTAIERYPKLLEKIEKVIWMAGAFTCDGNIKIENHDGSAEWNVFWDSISARKLVGYNLDLTMIPIEACKNVSVNDWFLSQLTVSDKFVWCVLVSKMIRAYNSIPHFVPYDLVAAVYLAYPEIGKVNHATIDIETRGTSAGNIYKKEDGHSVKYLDSVPGMTFFEYVLSRLR